MPHLPNLQTATARAYPASIGLLRLPKHSSPGNCLLPLSCTKPPCRQIAPSQPAIDNQQEHMRHCAPLLSPPVAAAVIRDLQNRPDRPEHPNSNRKPMPELVS